MEDYYPNEIPIILEEYAKLNEAKQDDEEIVVTADNF